MWSSRCTFFSPVRVVQEKCISRETDITRDGANSQLSWQPLKIPLGRGKGGAGTACQQSRPSSPEQPPSRHHSHLVPSVGLPRATEPGVGTPPSTHPPHPGTLCKEVTSSLF